MKQLLLFITLSLTIGIARAELRVDKLVELDTQLALLLPGNSNYEQSARSYAKKQIQALLNRLEDQRIRRKSPKKALQILEEEVSRRFLRQPAYLSTFQQLFTLGQYDTSTASALYAVTMAYFDLPYVLKVCDTEVMLEIAIPENARSFSLPHGDLWTAPSNQGFQNAYLEVLRSIGYLSPAEWKRSPEALYNQYYLDGQTELNLRQMASFFFCRQALKAYYDQAWSTSLDWLHRAKQLQPWPVQDVIRRAVWLQLAANPKGNTDNALQYLWMIWQENPESPWQRALLRHFSQFINHKKSFTIWHIDSTYMAYQAQFVDHPGALGQLRELYYLHCARFYARNNNTNMIMTYMDSLHNLRPQHQEVQDVLAGMLVWSLRAERDFEPGLKLIAQYERQYPFLASHTLFQDRHLFYQAERIRFHFNADEAVLGNRYLEEFKKNSSRISRPPGYVSWLSTAYLAASDYYFRQGNYQQAFILVEQARQEAPGDYYLDHRIDVLRQYLR